MNIRITKKQKVGLCSFFILLVVISSFVYFKNKSGIPEDEVKKNRVLVEDTIIKDEVKEASIQDNTSPTNIKAYICGYVVNPGVYTLNEGDRLDDLVKLAGGLTRDASLESINLAYKIKDQDYFKILSVTEYKDLEVKGEKVNNITNTFENVNDTSSSEEDKKININSDPKERLKELPRVGDALSQRIIDHRDKNGNFKSVEDIKEVSGIGDKMFENIKDKITVEWCWIYFGNWYTIGLYNAIIIYNINFNIGGQIYED